MKSNPSNPGFVLYLTHSSYYSNSVRWQDFAVTINFIGGRRIPEAAESYNDPIQINFYRLSLCWQYQYKSISRISKKSQSNDPIQINFYRLSLSRNTSTIIRTNQFWRFLKSHKVTILGSNTNNIHVECKEKCVNVERFVPHDFSGFEMNTFHRGNHSIDLFLDQVFNF